jgi:thiamine biosynthesis protein ThiI
MAAVILCRFGEIFLKRGNRRRFEDALKRNIEAALRDVPGARVETPHGRILVHVDDDHADAACDRLTRVFGLVSLSRAVAVKPELDAINQKAVELVQDVLGTNAAAPRATPASPAPTFKVEARRTDKTFPGTSVDIAKAVGAAIHSALALPVDVHAPALRVGVELTKARAYVHAASLPGPGGLPVGSSGRALLLLSGGIDSPVAGWLAAKRGLALDAIYFHSPPFIGERSKDKVVELARALARWQAVESLTVVPFTDVQKRLRDAGPAELAVVLYRRMMMRIADAVADGCRADALVTGENLGQVASQTVQNMTAIDDAARRLVLRPLVTYDKVETTALARRIGTYEISVQPYEDCCSLFVPRHPATAARASDAARAEATLDVAHEVATAAAAAERIPILPA